MIPAFTLPLLAKLTNAYLAQDPEMQTRLLRYDNRIVRFTLTTLDWTFFITFKQGRIELLPACNDPIDAALKTTLTALTKTVCNEKAIITEEMELSGDMTLLQDVSKIFRSIDMDWEELISHYTGDIIAHGIGNVTRSLKQFHEKAFSSQKKNISEYLQDEITLLVHPFQLEDFCDEVDDLREAVDRLAVKIDHAEKN